MEVHLGERLAEAIDYQNSIIMKGKRTKRPRQASPLALTMASVTSSSIISDNSGAFNKPTTSGGSTIEQYEEEDMANCLILLAQGGDNYKTQIRKESAAYECKTCNRSFPSFQALGGHRASHKKAKGAEEEANKKKKPMLVMEEDRFLHDCTQLSLQIVPNRFLLPVSSHGTKGGGSIRVHECSLCGAEFSSGQALGGHMRRHRTPSMVVAAAAAAASNVSNHQELVKISENGMLGLDLNLPAAEEEESHRVETNFPFASKEQVIVFSAASSLVDCHY